MLTLYRGFLAGLLIAGLVGLCAVPPDLGAQDKKKDAKDKDKDKGKGDDIKDRLVGVGSSDGLSLNGYWFQGVAIEKQRPDAVIMIPAPGSKINDAWISLATDLSKKNFSVLLMDWRGCGLNGPDGVGAGARIIEDNAKFWNDAYNGGLLLRSFKTQIETKGLDYQKLKNVSDARRRYSDFMLMNDLLAARFFLDKQNDSGKCNTNRTWIISEKDGAHVALAFIAAEFQRNTKYDPKINIFDTQVQFKSAGKDYAGIVALSYNGAAGTPATSTASLVYKNAMGATVNQYVKDGRNHLEDRLAMVMMFNKKEGASTSKSLINSVGVAGTEDEMKKKYKYLKEFDIKAAKPIAGIDLIDPMDSFGAKKFVVDAMVGISKAQPFNKDPMDRDAGKMVNVPRFWVEGFTARK